VICQDILQKNSVFFGVFHKKALYNLYFVKTSLDFEEKNSYLTQKNGSKIPLLQQKHHYRHVNL
jgi:hypothetical protein